jgi:hypothetical protein
MGKEELKISLIPDGMLSYVEDSQGLQKKIKNALELISLLKSENMKSTENW